MPSKVRGHGIIFILPYAIVSLKTHVFLSMRIVLQIVVNHDYDTVGTFTSSIKKFSCVPLPLSHTPNIPHLHGVLK